MQRLDLNLASNPFRNNSILWVGYGTATVLLVMFTVWNVNSFVDYRTRLLELRDTVGTFQSQRMELEARGRRALDGIERFDIDALEVKTHKANEVIEWKAFSWTRLFNVLERVLPNQVRMNSVRPIFNPSGRGQDRAEDQTGAMPVSIEGTARTFDALADLQRAFHSDPHIGRVEPERLDKTDNGEFVFQMSFMYLPDAGGEETPGLIPADGEPEAEAGEIVAEEGDPDGVDGGEASTAEQPDGDTIIVADDGSPAPSTPPDAEITDPGPPGEPASEAEVTGPPASKAKRTGEARQRSDPRRRQPRSRDDGKDQP